MDPRWLERGDHRGTLALGPVWFTVETCEVGFWDRLNLEWRRVTLTVGTGWVESVDWWGWGGIATGV